MPSLTCILECDREAQDLLTSVEIGTAVYTYKAMEELVCQFCHKDLESESEEYNACHFIVFMK